MNIIDSVTEGILSPKKTGRIRSETESFRLELREKVLSDGFNLSQIIGFLEGRISEKNQSPL